MQFGMPTLIETKTLEENAALCHELGLSFVELNMNLPQYQADRLSVSELRRIADKYGIYYTIHLDENLNPCDFNNAVAVAYTDTVLRTIEVAKALSVPVLNMHMNAGVWFTLPDKKVFLFDEHKADYLQKLTVFRDKCTAAIGGAGIKITVENCGDYQRFPFIVDGLDLLLQSPAFALCFDIGHNASADYTDEPTIMARSERLHHMHIHDAKGRANHLPLGEGDVDLDKYLKLAKQHNCRAVIEVKTVDGLRQSVVWL
ncbi:MAG: sugar phosphate isomerase/epimerase [Oscillospiraceae bacterium]|jgi:sugar phosphate isomerase/epimerase|nr:sugar phosphate isomerase/epimerase [Oscillospiraceae bacterium]